MPVDAKKSIEFLVLNTINKDLGYLKDSNERFLGKNSNDKRKIDMVLLGAARAIFLKQSLIEIGETKNHERILKDVENDLSDPNEIVFLSQIMGYFSQLKKRVDNPHHIIFDIRKCLKIVRSYFESSWNLGDPTYQEIITKQNYHENKIMDELFDKLKKISKSLGIEEHSEESEDSNDSDENLEPIELD